MVIRRLLKRYKECRRDNRLLRESISKLEFHNHLLKIDLRHSREEVVKLKQSGNSSINRSELEAMSRNIRYLGDKKRSEDFDWDVGY